MVLLRAAQSNKVDGQHSNILFVYLPADWFSFFLVHTLQITITNSVCPYFAFYKTSYVIIIVKSF